MAAGIGSPEASLIVEELAEFIVALESTEGIVLNVHDKKGTYSRARGTAVMPAPERFRSRSAK